MASYPVERLDDRGCLRQVEQQPRRGTVAPVVEAALSGSIGGDHVEPRQAPGHAHDEACPHAFRLPGAHHLLAPGIVAERRDVVHGHAKTRQVYGRVQGVAAIAARQQRARGLRQLDHALADGCNSGHCGGSSRAVFEAEDRSPGPERKHRLSAERVDSASRAGPRASRCSLPTRPIRVSYRSEACSAMPESLRMELPADRNLSP